MSEVICHCPACQQPLGLLDAVTQHHAQKADDRCWMDDDTLYAAAGLPVCDRRVGDKEEMLFNCERFLLQRCEGGHWPSYAEMEAERDQLRERVKVLEEEVDYYHDFLAKEQAYALAAQQQAEQTIADLRQRLGDV